MGEGDTQAAKMIQAAAKMLETKSRGMDKDKGRAYLSFVVSPTPPLHRLKIEIA